MMHPLPQRPDRGRAGHAWIAIAVVAAALLGVCVALAGVAALAQQALEAFRNEGGTWRLAADTSDSVVNSFTEEGVAFPERDLDDPLLASRTIVVTEGMNERTARSVARKLMFLAAQDPARPIEIYLSTPGGWFDSAFAIVGVMRAIPAPVNVTAIGGCHSAGAVVLASATGRRRAVANAIISVHADITESEVDYDSGTRERARVEGVYRERAKLPREWFPLAGDRSYYLTAREALAFGLIDEILAPVLAPPAEAKP